MASSPSSRLTFFNESGGKIAFPTEGREYYIVIDIPKELHAGIVLKFEDGFLQVYSESSTPHAYSIWPASGPGQYKLALSCGAIREYRTITVVPEHFTEFDFNSMINDLTMQLPQSIASKLSQCGVQLNTERGRKHQSIEEEWYKIRDAIKGTQGKLGLLQILPIIERDCNKILSPRLEVRTINKIRRPDISKLPQAISMPGNMIAEDELYQMFDVAVAESYETYENQLVKTYVQAVRGQLSRLQTKVKVEQAPPALANAVDALVNEFHLACTRSVFLRKVKRPSTSAERVTMVLLKNPAYRAVLEGYLGLNQQSSITLEEEALNTPLNKFPFLYQLWINLRVLTALLEVCAESGYRCVSHHWVKSFRRGTFIQVVNDGQTAVQLYNPVTGTQVNVVPFRPVRASQNVPSQERNMALAVAIEAQDKPLVVLLFDPRYRVALKGATTVAVERNETRNPGVEIKPDEQVGLTEPVKEDIDEFLQCIEQLRDSAGEHGIQYAALLYPGDSVHITAGVEALTAHPLRGELLHQNLCAVFRHYLK